MNTGVAIDKIFFVDVYIHVYICSHLFLSTTNDANSSTYIQQQNNKTKHYLNKYINNLVTKVISI